MENSTPFEYSILRKHFCDIVDCVDVTDVTDKLFADGVLNASEVERIQNIGVIKQDKSRE